MILYFILQEFKLQLWVGISQRFDPEITSVVIKAVGQNMLKLELNKNIILYLILT